MTTEDVAVIKNTESGGRGRNLPIGVVLTPTIFFASFLTIWELAVRLGDVQVLMLPAPSVTVSYTHLTLPTNREV